VVAAFLSHSAITGSWGARVPTIKQDVGLTDAQLGLALAAMAAGTLIGGRLGGLVSSTFGGRAVVRIGIPAYAIALVVAAAAGSLATLIAALLAFGIVAAVVDVAMNTEAVVVERLRGRPLISGFHGVWSVGLMLGALGGVVAAGADVEPVRQFAVVAVIVAAAYATALAGLPHPGSDARDAHADKARWSLGLVLLGLIAFSSFVAEGAAADWAAVYLHEHAGSGTAVAAAGFAGFSLAMAGSRFLGDWLAVRFGPVRLVRTACVMAATGMALALLVQEPPAGIVGFALLLPHAWSAEGPRRMQALAVWGMGFALVTAGFPAALAAHPEALAPAVGAAALVAILPAASALAAPRFRLAR